MAWNQIGRNLFSVKMANGSYFSKPALKVLTKHSYDKYSKRGQYKKVKKSPEACRRLSEVLAERLNTHRLNNPREERSGLLPAHWTGAAHSATCLG